ncbi:hypothetical protein [Paraburkholderia nemoris]|uniref:hypothetical protein n=1 Tax=Paraburkholderia nemoris TaxID=2793076 RepID=UPI001B8CD1DD|nr:hypothetical protein [Paraburkholderia nemoris]
MNDLQVAEEMEAAGRAGDAAHVKDDLRSASDAVLGGAIDAMNLALHAVGIQYLVGPEEGLVAAAHNISAARKHYEQAQRATVKLAYLDGVIGEAEASNRVVLSCADGDRSEAAQHLAEYLANLHAARVDAHELANGVESGEALRELCIATALLERRQAQVLARVAKQHIAHAQAATTTAYAAADKLGEITDRHLGAGAWAKLLAG